MTAAQPAALPDPVNVLLVKGNYGRAGGPETLLASLAKHIDRASVSPSLLVLRRDGVPEAPQMDADQLPIPRTDLPWTGLSSTGVTTWRLNQIVKQRRVKLIHTHDMRANLVAYFLKRLANIPWIAHVHGWLGHTQTGRWRLYEKLDQQIVPAADLVLVGSTAAKAEVEAAGAKRVGVLPNGVEVFPDQSWVEPGRAVRRQLGVTDSTVLAGVVGRVHQGKGQRYLLEAVARLRRESVDVRALIVGEGPDLEELRSLAGELGVADAVHFPGFCLDATPYVAAMDVFVAPSLKESLPLSVLEAMAIRRPVIASRVGDLPTVIDHARNGFLTPPGDAAAIASSLQILASDASLRQAIGGEARRTIEAGFSAAAMSRRLEAFYLAVLGERRAI